MPIIASKTPPATRPRLLAALAALVLSAAALALPGAARAATLTVIGDVNAGSAANLRLYENVLAGGRTVLFARSFGQMTGVVGHYRTIGADPVAHDTEITPGVLDGTDLLVMTANYNTFLDFSAVELAAMRDYGLAGGRILMVTEAALAPVIDSYNAVLDAIGARIRFTGARFAQTEVVGTLPDTVVTAGLGSFRVSPYNTLTGGTAAVQASGGTAIAFETLGAPVPVPVPGAGPAMAG
uniref:hypothetical protein n=1 Tax=Meridianimarinicoccus zhengii TaxID=2056810 RepID=UPI0013A690CF